MRRREFSKAATAGAAVAAATAAAALAVVADTDGRLYAGTRPAPGAGPGPGPASAAGPGPHTTGSPKMGTNLSGMEWARPGLRFGSSSLPNVHFTVPRAADVAYLASCGYTRNRLPIQWELLQPMLHDTRANEAARALIGQPGEFHADYEAFITGVLDAHARAGITCIIDLHNYCRYQDFVFQPDGSVLGLTRASNPLVRPYSSDPSQVRVRIFALAPGATLKPSNLSDFWTRAARRWKSHPGFGGYGLMNEPHDMPRPGAIEASSGGGEDLSIWPAFARAAIDAIRAVDPVNPIYLGGNSWSSAMSIATNNPGWPLPGENLIYEVHMYLDASAGGAAFDYDTEVGKNFSAGGSGAIHANTGVERLKIATDWARAKGVRLALTEVGMPIDDPRWEQAFKRTMQHAHATGCEVYSWMGGNHWPIRNYAINHVPGWHQNKTLEPAVSGPMKAAAGIAGAALFDEGAGWVPAGTPTTITVRARGHLRAPLALSVGSSNGGVLGKTRLLIPAGANGSDSFSYTSAGNRIATLSYAGDVGDVGGAGNVNGGSDGRPGIQLPPPRKVFSLSDPVAYAATSVADAAAAILARYGACKWELADGHTDYLSGRPAVAGQAVRAIADSGFGSTSDNAMEMLNWINKDHPAMGDMSLPVLRLTRGKKHSDHTAENTFGFWCKKSASMPGIQRAPRNRVPYDLQDPHFTIAVISIPDARRTGAVFQASKTEARHHSELGLQEGRPRARWSDAKGQTVELVGADVLAPGVPSVLTMTCAPGDQQLRLQSAVIARGNANLAPSAFTQFLIGWGYLDYYPQPGFGGHVYGVITGKGLPTSGELRVLERYLAGLATPA